VPPLSPDLPEGALMRVVFLTLTTSAVGSAAPPKDQRKDEAVQRSVDYEFAYDEIMSLSTRSS